MADGNVVRSHQDHLRSRYAGGQASQTQPTEDVDDLDSHIMEDPGQPDRNTPSPDSDEAAFEITTPERVDPSSPVSDEATPVTTAPAQVVPSSPGSLPGSDSNVSTDTVPSTPTMPQRHRRQQSMPGRVYPQRERRAPDYCGKT